MSSQEMNQGGAGGPPGGRAPDGSQPGVWVEPSIRADLASWGVAMLWGGSSAAVELSLEHGHPLRLAMLRLLLAAVTMFIIDRIAHVKLRPNSHEAVFLGALGLLFAGHIAAGYYGLSHTSVSHASVLLGANPMFAIILAHFLIPGDRLERRSVAGMIIVYAGLIILFSQHFSGEGETLTGDLLMVAAAATIAVRQVWVARLTQWIHPAKVVFWETLVAAPFFIIASLIVETDGPFWHWELLIATFYQGFLMFGVGLFVNTKLLQRYLPSRILATQMMIPIFGVMFGWALFNEPFGWELGAAIVLTTLGTIVSPRRPITIPARIPGILEPDDDK